MKLRFDEKVTIFNKPLKSLGNIKIRGSPARTFSRPIRTRIRRTLVFIGKTKGNQWFSSVGFEKNHGFYEKFDEKVKKCPKRIYIYIYTFWEPWAEPLGTRNR